MEKILIVEDDEKLARMIELELVHEDYEVEKAGDGVSGLKMAEEGDYDIVLLDIMLPGMSGIEVLRRLHKSRDVPVILLTARDETVDKVLGLDSGADDYVTKPFAIEELLARIRAALRKARKPSEPGGADSEDADRFLEYNGLRVDKDAHSACFMGGSAGGSLGEGPGEGAGGSPGEGSGGRSGEGPIGSPGEGSGEGSIGSPGDSPGGPRDGKGIPVELTHKEFELLVCLLENKGRVMSRDALLNKVWGYDYIGETNVVDVYVRFLRSKIDERFGIKIITTVRGAGYKIG